VYLLCAALGRGQQQGKAQPVVLHGASGVSLPNPARCASRFPAPLVLSPFRRPVVLHSAFHMNHL
jgi:hypothetical protein